MRREFIYHPTATQINAGVAACWKWQDKVYSSRKLAIQAAEADGWRVVRTEPLRVLMELS